MITCCLLHLFGYFTLGIRVSVVECCEWHTKLSGLSTWSNRVLQWAHPRPRSSAMNLWRPWCQSPTLISWQWHREEENFRDGQNKRWRCTCNPGNGVFFMAADVSDYVLYLLLFWSSTCSLLLSAERILGSTRDSKVSIMTGSTSFSQACKELTYHIKAHSCYLLGQKDFFISENKVSLNLDQKLKYRQCFSYLTLCCSMASRALNSKGKECVCDASWEARSSTSQRSKPRPRKSNTSSDWGVTIAFRVWKVTY